MPNKAFLPRILLWLSRGILGLVGLMVLLVILFHLAPVQKKITAKVSNYLSAKVSSKVNIDRIHLSLWDGIAIKELEVYDPQGDTLLVAERLGVLPDLFSLLTGRLTLDYVGIKGFNGHLIKTETGTNIHFIIDAFSPNESTDEQKEFSIKVDRLYLQGIEFEYLSYPDSINFQANIGQLDVNGIDLSTDPGKLKLSRILLENSETKLIYAPKSAQQQSTELPPLDFGSGFTIEVGNIDFNNNRFTFHQKNEQDSLHFDPQHLDFDHAALQLSNLFVSNKSLSFHLKHLGFALPGFVLDKANARISVNPTDLSVTDVSISSAGSALELKLEASYKNWSSLMQDLEEASADFTLSGKIQSDPFLYFAPSLKLDWPLTEINFIGRYNRGGLKIDKASLLTGNNQLSIKGELDHLTAPDSLSWMDLNISSNLDTAFIKFGRQYLGNISIPLRTQLSLLSTGSVEGFELDGQIKPPQGEINIIGNMGFDSQGVGLDLQLEASELDLGSLVSLPWLGRTDFTLRGAGDMTKGLEFDGSIAALDVFSNQIHQIDVNGKYLSNYLESSITINDPDFNSTVDSQIHFNDSINLSVNVQLESFRLGHFIDRDSLLVTGSFDSNLSIDDTSYSGFLSGRGIDIDEGVEKYNLDSLQLNLTTSPDGSEVSFDSDDTEVRINANFSIQQAPELIRDLIRSYQYIDSTQMVPPAERNLNFAVIIDDPTLLKLLDPRFESISKFETSGGIDETDQRIEMQANIHRFNGFGTTFDTLQANFDAQKGHVDSQLLIKNIAYDSIRVGDLNFDILDEDDGLYSNLRLTKDSIRLLAISSNIKPATNGLLLRLDSLIALNRTLNIDVENNILIAEDNVAFDHFVATDGELKVLIDGDIDSFEFEISNADLRILNHLVVLDSSTVNNGKLDAKASYSKEGNSLNLNLEIDSLIVKNSPPVNIVTIAKTEGNSIPIDFRLTSSRNNLELTGVYTPANSEIEANLTVDISNLEMFQFLFQESFETIQGSVIGQTSISGNLTHPSYRGSLQFQEVDFTTAKPRATFRLDDEILTLDNSGVILEKFTIYDQWQNPLVLNGVLRTRDYQSFDYDFSIDTDNYLLVNNPATEEFQLQGILVVGSNLKVTGNEKDTRVNATLVIKDTTDLTYVLPKRDLELLSNEGIVEFVDPNEKIDSTTMLPSQSFYDSVMATLPSFTLDSKLELEDQATFRVLIDARSGDYIEASGSAKVDLTIDRSGNMQVEGNYTITKGFYKLSFYDLVKKEFEVAPGSSVTWTGDPANGALEITAIHRISSSSIGLIGHEIGNSERELYKRALPYEVGIVIRGTIENPIISFALDLPQVEKANFPVLANKLDRLTQPEFESELNRQVFGLLVLGGFIPETSGTDIDQSLIASTALSNSVNSILASQLNRFAGQLVKGVDINVGLQSYSDFTYGSAQTRTAMDFRVSKSMMNDRLSVEVGGGMDIDSDQSGANVGSDSFRGDIMVIYDLTEAGTKQLKLFNNETYDIIYHEIRNTGISLIFIKDFDKGEKSLK